MDRASDEGTHGATTALERHFTVSAFLSHDGRTALHWHRLGMWLPPGGHIEPSEDPLQAAVREVEEETGIPCEIVPTVPPHAYEAPQQLPPPVTIGVYDIAEPGNPHQHIDLVYFATPLDGVALDLPANGEAWRWVPSDVLSSTGATLPGPHGEETPIAEDVRRLGLAAIEAIDAHASMPRRASGAA